MAINAEDGFNALARGAGRDHVPEGWFRLGLRLVRPTSISPEGAGGWVPGAGSGTDDPQILAVAFSGHRM